MCSKAIPFFRNAAVRELLCMLRQYRFEAVPQEMVLALRAMFGGFHQTAINENAHNVIKDHLRDIKGSTMAPHQRWMMPHVEGTVSQFERDDVDVNAGDRAGPRQMPKGVYDALGGGGGGGALHRRLPVAGHPRRRPDLAFVLAAVRQLHSGCNAVLGGLGAVRQLGAPPHSLVCSVRPGRLHRAAQAVGRDLLGVAHDTVGELGVALR